MKFKTTRDKLRKTTALEADPSKGTQLDYASSRLIMEATDPFLLRMKYDESGGVPVFRFDITDRISLSEYLSAVISKAQFIGLLEGVCSIARLCDDNALNLANTVFLPSYVYVDTLMAPAFAYVPLTKPDTNQGNINEFLSYCASKAHFSDSSDSRFADSLADWLRRRPVFSLTEFVSFLGDLKGTDTSSISLETVEMLEFSSPIPSLQTAYDFVAVACEEESSSGLLASSFALVRVKDNHPWPLPFGQLTLGRGASCDIVVSQSTDISREHARLRVDNEGCSVCDVDSSNGVKVNGRQLTSGEYTAIPQGTSFFLAEEEFIIK